MGWVSAVTLDCEMGTKTFNAMLEAEVAPGSVDTKWPPSWDARIAPLWTRLGGTMTAARAWATAGWDHRDVLRLPRLSRYWNIPMTDRLQVAEVPPVNSIDAPPREGSTGPAGDHTIAEFLEVAGEQGGS